MSLVKESIQCPTSLENIPKSNNGTQQTISRVSKYIHKDRLDKMHMKTVSNDVVSECPDRRLTEFGQFGKCG